MKTVTKESVVERPPSKPARVQVPDIASASVPDTLAALHVNPETGLTRAAVDTRRIEHGYNEVAEQKGHPALKFLGKFWGLSAWMLELIILLSLVLRHYSSISAASPWPTRRWTPASRERSPAPRRKPRI